MKWLHSEISLMSTNFLKPPDAPPQPGRRIELTRTHAEMLAAEASTRAAKRRVELEELRSELNSPEQRVRAWERVHGLALPLDPNHPILDVIAIKTRLTMQQVQAVQRSDAARRAARFSSQKP
jgi:hypothetical protein